MSITDLKKEIRLLEKQLVKAKKALEKEENKALKAIKKTCADKKGKCVKCDCWKETRDRCM